MYAKAMDPYLYEWEAEGTIANNEKGLHELMHSTYFDPIEKLLWGSRNSFEISGM